MTEEQHEQIMQFSAEFNMAIQAAFLEMMEKMSTIKIDHPHANVLTGNYGPTALGAAIAAIVARYDAGCEEEFWKLVMNKYTEAKLVLEEMLANIDAADLEEPEGVTEVEMMPNVFDISKMKH